MRRELRRAAPTRELPVVAILALVLAGVVVACGAALDSGSPGSPTTAGSAATASAAPPASGAAASGDVGVGPEPTSWPGGVVEAVVILGKADLEIKEAGGDLANATASEDLEAMWGAADGLATLIDKLTTQVDRIRDYPVTAPAAKAYDAAFPDMGAGAKQIRDSITAGDAAGITAGFQRLAKGTAAYEAARREIGPLVEPALLMQRILVK